MGVGLLIMRGRDEEGPTSKGNDREEREKRRDGKGGEGDPPKSM